LQRNWQVSWIRACRIDVLCGGAGDEPDLPLYMESALRDARDELVGRRAA